MKMFARIAVLCNLAFVLSVIMRFLESKNYHPDNIIPYTNIRNTIIIMGYGAIVVNFLFFSSLLFLLMVRKKLNLPLFYMVCNGVVFISQVIYFFIW
ncbi:MAG: hypothetical protein KF829_05400 [Ferruginibacter sp.]|nr:hypothetical protein [Ferruginibacter sp.]